MMTHVSKFLVILILLCLSSVGKSQCIANFTFSDQTTVVFFQDESTAESDIVSYQWNFGDGGTSGIQSPTHIFANAGEQTVSLSILTADGCTDTLTQSFYICNINTDLQVSSGCNITNTASISIIATDMFDNLGDINLRLNGALLNENPLAFVDGTIEYDFTLLADGEVYELQVEAIDLESCSITRTFTVPACVPPCAASDLSAEIVGTETYTVLVNEDNYQPATLNIQTGDYIQYIWNTDNRSVTTDNDNGQNWDSGLRNMGDTFMVYSYDPGILNYQSTDGSSSMTGSVVSTCPDTAYYDLLLTFENTFNQGFYFLQIDGVPVEGIYSYSNTGFDTLAINIPGDGKVHTYDIVNAAESSCIISTTHQSPICGVMENCNLFISAAQSSVCDEDSLVMVDVDILSSGESSTFNIFLDGVIVDSNLVYTDTTTTVSILVPGDFNTHIITVVDGENETCSAFTQVVTEDCASPCQITNFFAGIGSTNVFIVNVNEESYTPEDIVISAGDRIVWQWVTDSLRSVTAFDFSFDSGLRGMGYSYLSPYLEVGLHRYYSDLSDMTGSITVQPNCVDGQVPALYSFDKLGGAVSGYNLFFDDIQLNNQPLNYADNATTSGSMLIDGDGLPHTYTIVDIVDTTCTATGSFVAPACDASVCAIFLGDAITSDCNENNTLTLTLPVTNFNTDTLGFQVIRDGVLLDSIYTYDDDGTTEFDIIVQGDSAIHQFVIFDVAENSCTDTLVYQSILCTSPCSFDDLAITYIEENVADTCFDGSSQIDINFTAISDFSSLIVAQLLYDTVAIYDTISYTIDGSYSLNYMLPADGQLIDFSIYNLENTDCRLDTSFVFYSCDADPCNITVSDIQYGACQDFGIMDFSFSIDTFRVQDSLIIELEGDTIYQGTYADFSDTLVYQIQYNGMQRTLTLSDPDIPGCVYDHLFFTQFCPTDCNITSSYTLVDSCVAVDATTYDILLTAQAINAISDSVFIEVLGVGQSFNSSYADLASGITITLPLDVQSISIGIYDLEDANCRSFRSIIPPDCILNCNIEIDSFAVVEKNTIIALVTNNGIFPTHIEAEIGDSLIFINQTNDQEIILTEDINQAGAFNSGFFAVGDSFGLELQDIGQFSFYSLVSGGVGGVGNAGTLNVSYPCENGNTEVTLFINYMNSISDSLQITVDGSSINTMIYPSNNQVNIPVIGDGQSHNIVIADNSDPQCADTIQVEVPLCEFTCSDFLSNFTYTIDTVEMTVRFNETSTDGSDRWSWQFGDGSASVVRNPMHTYTDFGEYEVCLTSTNTEENCSDIYCETINIVDISCEAMLLTTHIGLELNYTAALVGGGMITNADFTVNGITIPSSGTSGVYTAPSDGNYELCTEITTITGCVASTCTTVSLIALCDITPSFDFTISNDTISLTNTSNGNYDFVEFSLDNGVSFEGNEIQYIYPSNGEYEVCLTIANTPTEGCTETICQTVNIDACRVDATFEFTVINDSLYANIIDLNQSTDFDWDFGNGFSSSNNPVSYIYTADGDYLLCATVENDDIDNCEDTQCQSINITITDIDQEIIESLNLYPNPVKRNENIIIDNINQIDFNVSIYDKNGRLISSKFENKNSKIIIDSSNLSAGTYTIQLSTVDGDTSLRVIVVE